MSSFNHVEKIKYRKFNEEPVSLIEYIIFTDDKNCEKQAILKFRNNLNQILSAIKVNVYEYDENHKLLAKSLIAYDSFTAQAQEIFVPSAKINLTYEVKSIEVNLEYALFERLVWEEKKLNVIPYTREEFKSEFTTENNTVVKEPHAIKVAKENKGKRTTKFDNIVKRNIPKGPRIFTKILSVLLVAFILFFAISHRMSITYFDDENFQYSKSGNYVTILKYIGESNEVVINNRVSGMKITKIGNEAFKDSTIESITFNAKDLNITSYAFDNCDNLKYVYDYDSVISIGSYAFNDCDMLSQIEFNNVETIESKAFYSCDKLSIVEVPNANVDNNAFANCPIIRKISYGSTTAYKFINLFMDSNAEIEFNVIDVATNQKNISKNFFEGCENISNIDLNNPEVVVEYGAFKNLTKLSNYEDKGTYEIYKGKIISYSSSSPILKISADDDSNRVSEILNVVNPVNIKEMYIDNNAVVINEQFISQFPNVEKLIVGENTSFELESTSSAFSNKLKTLSLNVNMDNLNEYVKTAGLTGLELYGSGVVTKELLVDLSNITYLKIENTINNIETNALASMVNLIDLDIPNIPNSTLETLGVSKTLKTLKISNCSANALLSEGFVNNYGRLTDIIFADDLVVSRLESNFISDCVMLNQIVFPNSISRIEDGAIGSGCPNLKSVTIPFVGTTTSRPSSYQKINYSYSSTTELTITSNCAIDQTFSDGLDNLKKLIFTGKITTIQEGCFSNINTLTYLEIGSSVSVNSFADLFGRTNIYIKTLVINDLKSNSATLFANIDINNLIILKMATLQKTTIVNVDSNIKSLYIGDVSRDLTDYSSLTSKVTKFYFKSTDIPAALVGNVDESNIKTNVLEEEIRSLFN